MTSLRLRYVQALRDSRGVRRYYFRRAGAPRVTLPGLPGSAEFMAAYQAALGREVDPAPPRVLGAERTAPGSFAALIVAYYESAEFRNLAADTRRTYRNMIERFRQRHGHLSVAGFQTRHAARLLDEMADRPGAAYNLRRVLRILMRFAVERGWRDANPMAGMRRTRRSREHGEAGFRTWTEEDIARFEAHWHDGSRARLALHLLLYTAQRRQDVVTLGRQHMRRDGTIDLVQLKGGTRLAIPIHPRLQQTLARLPADNLTFLMTSFGKPFSAPGFTNWFTDCARAAGLPKPSTPHGLRKAAARRLAEAGATPHEIKAITGHKNLSEVTLYTAAADQQRLAKAGMNRLQKGETGTPAVNSPEASLQKRRKAE